MGVTIWIGVGGDGGAVGRVGGWVGRGRGGWLVRKLVGKAAHSIHSVLIKQD